MKVINTTNAPAAVGPYSQGMMENGFIFLSGQLPIDPKTGIMPETIEEQAHESCKNVGALLKEAGSSFDRVIKTTCFLSDMADFAAFNSVYEKYFTSRPARSCVAVKELPKGAKCEIEVVAY